MAHPASFPEAISQRAQHQWFQCFSLVSLGLFSLFPGEISSLDGKCCVGCVTTKLIQTIVEYNLWFLCFHKCSLFWFKWLLNHSHACFSVLLRSFIYFLHFSSLACKAFCFFYGLQCKQPHPSNSTSGTTLSTELDCGKLIREERGIRAQPSIHTV